MKILNTLFRMLFQVFCVVLITGFLGMVVVYVEYYSGENSEYDLFTWIMLSGLLVSFFVVTVPFFKWLLKKNKN